MILFKPQHVEPILAGRKTETRRIWKALRVKVGSIQKAKTKMISSEYFAKIWIKYVFRQRLGNITEEEAHREGYESRSDYLNEFAKINKIPLEKLDLNMIVWVVGFEVVPDGL